MHDALPKSRKDFSQQQITLCNVPSQYITKPRRITASRTDHRDFFDRLFIKLGYSDMDDWYNVKVHDIHSNGGYTVLDRSYSGSPSKALQSVYPEHNWIMWKFVHIPKRYWDNMENQRMFFDWPGTTLGYKEMKDWYKVTKDDVNKYGGGGSLQTHYCNSVAQALQAVYPEYNWISWNFGRVPKGLWSLDHRVFFNWLGTQLGYKCLEDWYNVSKGDIFENGGSRMLQRYYGGSVSRALQTVYPEHDWFLWRFDKVPQGYCEKLKECPTEMKRVLNWLSTQLSIADLDDWYRISVQQIQRHTTVIREVQVLMEMLCKVYPEHNWDMEKLSRQSGPVKSSQRILFQTVKVLFKGEDVREDFKHFNRLFGGPFLELDVYVPKYQLAFEYQGAQHYKPVYNVVNYSMQVKRDQEKRESCKKAGVKLIEVPYWWDFQKESLAATINQIRSQQFQHTDSAALVSFQYKLLHQSLMRCRILCMKLIQWDFRFPFQKTGRMSPWTEMEANVIKNETKESLEVDWSSLVDDSIGGLYFHFE